MADYKVEVISTCTVKTENSNANNSHHISSVELTPWDLKALPLHPIQKGLLFCKPQSQDFQKTIINHLKNTLALALDYFPPLAGRLAKINENNTTHFFVDCNNAGATFTHALAHGIRVHDILEPVHTPVIVCSFFALNGLMNYDSLTEPLLAVQVTELVDGFFVACTINHCVADGTSFWHFFNSWSEISRGLSTISKPPLFKRSLINDFSSIKFPIPVPEFEPTTNTPDNPSQPSYIERIFRFSKGSLLKLKAKANSEAGTDTISTLQALLAHTWRAMIRSRGVAHLDQQLFCAIITGTRQRLPLPDFYFGNAIYMAPVSMKGKDLVHKGLGWVALEMNKVVTSQTRDQALQDIGKKFEFIRIGPTLIKQLVLIGSTPRHNVYGVDFGWGKAVAVRSGPATKFDGKINVYPSSDDDGGIDMEVCLAEESLVAMGKDAEFMEPLTTF